MERSQTRTFDVREYSPACLAPEGPDLSLSINYDTAAFGEAQVERIAEYYRGALYALAHDIDARHLQAGLLTNDERRLILGELNATCTAYSDERLAHELFEEQVRRTPDAVAVVYGAEQLSYAELNGRANQLAHYLREYGAGPDVVVGVCMQRCLEMLVAVLGTWKAGAAYVALDPEHPGTRLQGILADAAAQIVITQERFETVLAGTSRLLLALDRHWPVIAQQRRTNLDTAELGVTPRNLAYVIHTSGSTGRPQGVMVEHAGLSNYLRWAMAAYAPGQGRCIVSSPLTFDATVTSLYVPLVCGGSVVLVADRHGIDCLQELLQQSASYSLVKLSPAHLIALGEIRRATDARCDIRTFVIGGEALLPSTVQLWRTISPDAQLINEYGPTETVVGCCTYDIPDCWAAPDAVPIGRPIANAQIYGLDPSGEPLPIGATGEIHVGGAGVARGYANRPALTAELFVPDMFGASPGARLYRTGDLGRWRADGNLEYCGRRDTQVKVRGHRIELEEIEAQLSCQPLVESAALTVRQTGPADQRIVAYLKFRAEPVPCVDEVQLRLKSVLPDFMLPNAYVVLHQLPLTTSGKLDRKALQALDVAPELPRQHVAPQGEIENALARIWRELLQVDCVGRDDDFFALGGHSLLLTQALTRIRRDFALELQLSELFDAPTLRQWASHIEMHLWAQESVRHGEQDSRAAIETVVL